MKKIISLILSLSMLLSSLSVLAAEKTEGDISANEYIKEYVTETGIWKGGSFEEDRPVTRAELAGMLGRAIGTAELTQNELKSEFKDVSSSDDNFREIVSLSKLGIITGSDGYYRPNDNVTREETAIIIERIYKNIFNKLQNDKEYKDNRFLDFNEISPWAVQSVVNVTDDGIMPARAGRRFEPKVKTTLIEAAELAKKINGCKRNETPTYTISDASGDPSKKYEVYQTAKLATFNGISGFGLVGRFSSAPGKIYVERTTKTPDVETGTPVAPVCFARIINPDGEVVARVDLDYSEKGKMSREIDVPIGNGGIWTVEICNGRQDDIVGIGFSGAISWGLRPEPGIYFTETMPKELYLYVPKKVTNVDIGTSKPVSIRDLDGNPIVASSEDRSQTYAKYGISTSGLKTETVYRLYGDDMLGCFYQINGINGLLCPTPAMAEDLKGCYYYNEYGKQLQGVLQYKAAEAMAEIWESRNGNFDVVFDKPEELPKDEIKNPIGEAMSLGTIGMLDQMLKYQNIEGPEDPYFGYVTTSGEPKKAGSGNCWETGVYNTFFGSRMLLGIVTNNSVVNKVYDNQVVIDRATLFLLHSVMAANDCMVMRDTDATAKNAGSQYYYTHSNFYLEWMTGYFMEIKGFLEPKYAVIIEEALEQMVDKMMMYRGNGPNNQFGHGVLSALHMWVASGVEQHHEYFKRGVRVHSQINKGWNAIGQSKAGWFSEATGPDGNYNHMNTLADAMFYTEYCLNPNADPETAQIIINSNERSLKFESMFYSHYVEGLSISEPRHYTSRTDSSITNRGGQPGYSQACKYFPLARAMYFDNKDNHTFQENWSMAFPHLLCSEESAWKLLDKHWEKYDKYYQNRYSSDANMYDYFWDYDDWAETDGLPYQQKETVNEIDGSVVGFNHKGLYVMSFYDNGESFVSGTNGCSWFGGGPSIVSSETMSGIVSSRRHENSINKKDVGSVSDVVASCIYGVNKNGQFYVSGKEESTLNWIEKDKKFSIDCKNSDGRAISWIYELTDEGVTITPSVGIISANEEYWVNLPISNQTAEGYERNVTPGKIEMKYNGAVTTVEWDSTLKYDFVISNSAVTRLRIKLPTSGKVDIKFATTQKSE